MLVQALKAGIIITPEPHFTWLQARYGPSPFIDTPTLPSVPPPPTWPLRIDSSLLPPEALRQICPGYEADVKAHLNDKLWWNSMFSFSPWWALEWAPMEYMYQGRKDPRGGNLQFVRKSRGHNGKYRTLGDLRINPDKNKPDEALLMPAVHLSTLFRRALLKEAYPLNPTLQRSMKGLFGYVTTVEGEFI